MNGIDFMVRDRAGWMPSVPLPRRRLRWADPRAEAIKPEKSNLSERREAGSAATTLPSATACRRTPSGTFDGGRRSSLRANDPKRSVARTYGLGVLDQPMRPLKLGSPVLHHYASLFMGICDYFHSPRQPFLHGT